MLSEESELMDLGVLNGALVQGCKGGLWSDLIM